MPKLNAAQRQATETAEVKDFSPLAPGLYFARLKKVTVTPGQGDPYWETEWEVVSDAAGETRNIAGRKVWENVSTGQSSAWKMRAFFDALEFTYDSDTDEMIGEHCMLDLVQEEIQRGQRAGQMRNQIQAFRMVPEGWEPAQGTPSGF